MYNLLNNIINIFRYCNTKNDLYFLLGFQIVFIKMQSTSQGNMKMCQKNSECFYEHIQKNIHNLKLPSRQWSPVVDRNRSIKFVRIEHDLSCYLVVLLDSELNVRVYH